MDAATMNPSQHEQAAGKVILIIEEDAGMSISLALAPRLSKYDQREG